MGKYLELFLGEVGDLTEKTKLENKPYVAYSTKLGKVTYTIVPVKDSAVEGPADNEIWYTSTDEGVVTPYKTGAFGANIMSNTYENGKGVITFDGDVTSIGFQAFANCSRLTSVTIPNSVTSIGENAFAWCSSLTSITIPNSVTEIGEEVFANCSGLTSVTIPNSVTSIGENAFEYCAGLNSVTIGNSVTSIGWYTFKNCTGLNSVTIGNSVTSIGNYAFSSCSSLTSIVIPDGVASIGQEAFCGCTGLTSVTYEGTQEQWNTISKGSWWNYEVPATYVHCADGDVTL